VLELYPRKNKALSSSPVMTEKRNPNSKDIGVTSLDSNFIWMPEGW
jgi:hypothetical protein